MHLKFPPFILFEFIKNKANRDPMKWTITAYSTQAPTLVCSKVVAFYVKRTKQKIWNAIGSILYSQSLRTTIRFFPSFFVASSLLSILSTLPLCALRFCFAFTIFHDLMRSAMSLLAVCLLSPHAENCCLILIECGIYYIRITQMKPNSDGIDTITLRCTYWLCFVVSIYPTNSDI